MVRWILAVLVLAVIVLGVVGCDKEYTTTVTCQHIWFPERSYTKTVPGKNCNCKMFYAVTQCDPYCIDE